MCSDIRIIPNEEISRQLKSETPKETSSLKTINRNPIFQLHHWEYVIGTDPNEFLENNEPDCNKFTGRGIICFVIDNSNYNELKSKCYNNCRHEEKVCPPECKCRWYA